MLDRKESKTATKTLMTSSYQKCKQSAEWWLIWGFHHDDQFEADFYIYICGFRQTLKVDSSIPIILNMRHLKLLDCTCPHEPLQMMTMASGLFEPPLARRFTCCEPKIVVQTCHLPMSALAMARVDRLLRNVSDSIAMVPMILHLIASDYKVKI